MCDADLQRGLKVMYKLYKKACTLGYSPLTMPSEHGFEVIKLDTIVFKSNAQRVGWQS
jgi:hypothetical protein